MAIQIRPNVVLPVLPTARQLLVQATILPVAALKYYQWIGFTLPYLQDNYQLSNKEMALYSCLLVLRWATHGERYPDRQTTYKYVFNTLMINIIPIKDTAEALGWTELGFMKTFMDLVRKGLLIIPKSTHYSYSYMPGFLYLVFSMRIPKGYGEGGLLPMLVLDQRAIPFMANEIDN